MAERIDRYLRREMSAEESVRFEQEALNDNDLRKEIELTYIIRKGIIDRQRKLYKVRHWEYRRRNRTAIFVAAVSFAAMLVGGILVLQLRQGSLQNKSKSAGDVYVVGSVLEKNGQTMYNVKGCIETKNDYEVIAIVDSLEKNRMIPTLNDISDNRQFMNNNITKAEIIDNDSYELHWRKICSLIKIGKINEARMALQNFISIEGKYKDTADSLLQTLK